MKEMSKRLSELNDSASNLEEELLQTQQVNPHDNLQSKISVARRIHSPSCDQNVAIQEQVVWCNTFSYVVDFV